MKQIAQREIDKLLSQLPYQSEATSEAQRCIPVTLVLPNGEVINPEIRGFAWVWQGKGLLKPYRTEQSLSIAAQGLEGFSAIQRSLFHALLVVQFLPPRRYAILKDGH